MASRWLEGRWQVRGRPAWIGLMITRIFGTGRDSDVLGSTGVVARPGVASAWTSLRADRNNIRACEGRLVGHVKPRATAHAASRAAFDEARKLT